MEQEEINGLNKELRHLQHELRDNMDDDDDVSHVGIIPVKNLLKPNNTIGAHIVEGEKK